MRRTAARTEIRVVRIRSLALGAGTHRAPWHFTVVGQFDGVAASLPRQVAA